MSFRIPKRASEWKTDAYFIGAVALIEIGYLVFAYVITR